MDLCRSCPGTVELYEILCVQKYLAFESAKKEDKIKIIKEIGKG